MVAGDRVEPLANPTRAKSRGAPQMLIQEIGYSVPPGKEENHQAWVREHEESLKAAMHAGTELIGIFAMVYSSEKQAGFYRIFIKLDSYAGLDRVSEAMKDGDSDFGRLLREHTDFMDWGWDAPASNGLHKAVVDVAVFDQGR